MTYSLSRGAAGASISILCLVLAGCGQPGPAREAATESPSPSVTVSTPVFVAGEGTFATPEDADRTSADSTGEIMALMLHSWDTMTDNTQTAAAIRAVPLMNEEWAGYQVEPERNGAQGDWLKPSEHQAYSSPSVVAGAGDVAQDVAPDKAVRFYHVTWRWIGRDGVELPDTTMRSVTVYLERHDGLWVVVGHQSQDL